MLASSRATFLVHSRSFFVPKPEDGFLFLRGGGSVTISYSTYIYFVLFLKDSRQAEV